MMVFLCGKLLYIFLFFTAMFFHEVDIIKLSNLLNRIAEELRRIKGSGDSSGYFMANDKFSRVKRMH